MTKKADFVAQSEELLAPVKQLNASAVDKFEQLLNLQIASMSEFANIGIDNMRAALAVKDAEGFQTYVTNQRAVAQKLTDKISADAKAVAEIGTSFSAEVQSVTKQSVEKAAKKVA